MRRSLCCSIGLGLVFGAAMALSTPAHSAVIWYTSKASFDAASSTSLLETFEAWVPKDVQLAVIASNGVTYTPNPPTNVFVSSPGYNNYGAGVGTTTTSILTANGDEDFTATFSTPYTAIGFDVYLNGLGDVTVSIYGTSGLLDTFVDTRNLDTLEYYGFVSDEAITAIRFDSTLGGQLNTGIDNVAVGDALAVPEPAPLAVLGAGLLALAWLRRRTTFRHRLCSP
jgi:hypothetical protein